MLLILLINCTSNNTSSSIEYIIAKRIERIKFLKHNNEIKITKLYPNMRIIYEIPDKNNLSTC